MNPVCDVASDELIAFTEEDLPERRMKQLETHVPGCSHCQARLELVEANTTLLRKTMPEPDPHVRHDLLVRLYQETEDQTDRPHRSWTQVASLTAVGGTFLLAAVLLWSGLGQFVDSIPRPFQQAGSDQTLEWVSGENGDAELFETAPMPRTLGDEYPIYDQWVEAEIRLIIYQSGEPGATPIEVSQFYIEGANPEPPSYMEALSTVEGITVYVDDPAFIREIRWADGPLVHHVQMYAPEPNQADSLSADDAESIVRAFLDDH
jgi:hypothetical protein